MTPEQFREFAGVSRETLQLFQSYHAITLKWQAKINLISPTTVDAIWERHFADSAQIFRLLSEDDKTLADIGSGAGFPGLVLALIAHDQGRSTIFHLIEADSRKAAFLVEVAIATGLINRSVKIHAQRAEKLAAGHLAGQIDVVTSRALAALPELLGFAQPLLASTGRCLLLKGERAGMEIDAAHKAGWSFDLTRHQSRIDAEATVLEIHSLRRDHVLAASPRRKL